MSRTYKDVFEFYFKKKYLKVRINYICLFDYLFISS